MPEEAESRQSVLRTLSRFGVAPLGVRRADGKAKGDRMDFRSIRFLGRFSSRLWVLAGLLGGPACSGEAPELASVTAAVTAAVTNPPHPVPPPPGCFAKYVHQPETGNRSVDLLFVTDTSGSLSNEQDAVADALASMISQIDGQ